MTDFERTLELYKEFGNSLSNLPLADVQVTMYSDSILTTSKSLGKLLQAVQSLLFISLARQFVVRGAITKGRYWEQKKGNNLLVASDALVRAVKIENEIGIPAVVITDDIEIPDSYWAYRFAEGVFATPLLHFRDKNIVNPFNNYWFKSAAIHLSRMMANSPSHKEKYLWFLALYEEVKNDQVLVPQDAIKRLIDMGLLKDNFKDSR